MILSKKLEMEVLGLVEHEWNNRLRVNRGGIKLVEGDEAPKVKRSFVMRRGRMRGYDGRRVWREWTACTGQWVQVGCGWVSQRWPLGYMLALMGDGVIHDVEWDFGSRFQGESMEPESEGLYA